MMAVATFILGAAAMAADTQEVPVIDAELGPCSVNFVVTDSGKKPIYAAKIDVVIRYGFMSKRKIELVVSTNSDGKARVTGLLEKGKKPLEFHVTSGLLNKTVVHDPATKCDATLEVMLGDK